MESSQGESPEEIRKILRKRIILEPASPPKVLGGQSCGLPPNKMRLISEDLDLKIEFGYYRSQIKNAETVKTLFELILMETIK